MIDKKKQKNAKKKRYAELNAVQESLAASMPQKISELQYYASKSQNQLLKQVAIELNSQCEVIEDCQTVLKFEEPSERLLDNLYRAYDESIRIISAAMITINDVIRPHLSEGESKSLDDQLMTVWQSKAVALINDVAWLDMFVEFVESIENE